MKKKRREKDIEADSRVVAAVWQTNMLPPIAPSVLEANPKFKALYTNLAGSRLNADASTRLIKQQRAQTDIEKVRDASLAWPQ